jgi:hypothetical protein
MKMVVFEQGSAVEANFDKVSETTNSTIKGFQFSSCIVISYREIGAEQFRINQNSIN